MNNVKDLIVKMRDKPGMFLTNYSVYSVKAFIDGYTINRKDDLGLMYEFQQYIINKFNFPIVLSWDKAIRVYTNSDNESMKSFFKLFEEFIQQQQQA